METKEKRKLSQHAKGLATLFVAVMLLLCSMPMTAFAESGKTEITGKIYEFDKDSHYEFHEGGESKETGKTMGFDETWRIRCEQLCIYGKQ